MNRLHVHLKVKDLDKSIEFYSTLFAKAPYKREPDYAKRMLEDPRANIAISTRSAETGVDHVGMQVDTDEELEALAQRLRQSGAGLIEEPDTVCCYARSDKYWALSPDGAKWELYRSFADSKTFGAAPTPGVPEKAAARACCGA